MKHIQLNKKKTPQKIYKFIVSGSVQGVGFRFAIKEFAIRNGIRGTVKNNIDRTVDILFFGSNNEKELFKKFCYDNPAWSHVSNVVIQEITDENKNNEFQMIDQFTILR